MYTFCIVPLKWVLFNLLGSLIVSGLSLTLQRLVWECFESRTLQVLSDSVLSPTLHKSCLRVFWVPHFTSLGWECFESHTSKVLAESVLSPTLHSLVWECFESYMSKTCLKVFWVPHITSLGWEYSPTCQRLVWECFESHTSKGLPETVLSRTLQSLVKECF